MTKRSLRGAINAKCRDCGALDAGVNWREYIAVCPCTDCPLWEVRPLSANAPAWLTARTAKALPPGWTHLPQSEALAAMRNAAAVAPHHTVTAHCGDTRDAEAM